MCMQFFFFKYDALNFNDIFYLKMLIIYTILYYIIKLMKSHLIMNVSSLAYILCLINNFQYINNRKTLLKYNCYKTIYI